MHDDFLKLLIAFLGLPMLAVLFTTRRRDLSCLLLFATGSLIYCFLEFFSPPSNAFASIPFSEIALSMALYFMFEYYTSALDTKTHLGRLAPFLSYSKVVLLANPLMDVWLVSFAPSAASAFKMVAVCPIFALLAGANVVAVRLSVPSARLLLASLVAFLAAYASAQIFDWLGFSSPATKWILPFGLILAHAFLWISELNSSQFLKKERHERNRMLRLVSQKMWKSRERYQYLMENSGDTRFLLDKGFNFLFVGSGIAKQLGYKPEALVGRSFWELLHWNLRKASEQSIVDDMVALVLSNQEVVLPESFRTSRGFEKEMQLKLKAFDHEGEVEILGQMSEIHNDVLSKYLRQESATFHLRNNLCETDFLSRRLVAHLPHFLSRKEVRVVRTALREMLINAVEHGNLSLGFERKSELLRNQKYFEALNQRKQHSRHARNKITVNYSLSRREVRYEIADEGNGFDPIPFLSQHEGSNDSPAALELHGRGIAMARNAFDVVRYNEKGNKVFLVKYLAGDMGLPRSSKFRID